MPDEVKTALREVAVAYRDHVAGIAMDRAEQSRKAYVAAGGTIVEMNPAERTDWANAIPDIAAEWAGRLNKKGEAGSAMLKACLAKLKVAGYTGVRDWSAALPN